MTGQVGVVASSAAGLSAMMSSMGAFDDADELEPATVEEWSDWLREHHADRSGVWLVSAKAATGRRAFDYDTAVTEALRYGWVDSVQRAVDEERSKLWFAPRRARSGWSRSNKIRIERLEQEGRLEPAGRAAVEAARANGSWALLDEVEELTVPDDLAAALAAHPGSREHWDRFPPSARRAILEWIVQAKRAETRGRRVRETAEKAATGERANQWVPRDQR
ncbi:MAG: YdeI/OmpD-associated family protein [Actinomycetes bacterium]